MEPCGIVVRSQLDARLFAYVQSVDEGLDSALKHLTGAPLQDNYWRFASVYSLMWPRGGLVRKQALQTYNPFTSLPDTARLLVTAYILPEIKVVDVSSISWFEEVVDALQSDAICNLRASKSNLRETQGGYDAPLSSRSRYQDFVVASERVGHSAIG